MGKRISIWLALFCCLGSTAAARIAGEPGRAGRAVLFEGTNGSLAEACRLFEAAAVDAIRPRYVDDRESVFLHALARAVRLVGDYRHVFTDATSREVAESLGLTFADSALEDFRAILPAGATGPGPSAPKELDELRETLRAFVLPELTDIVGALDSIEDGPDPFLVILTPRETGLMSELEIDYADVLLLKSVLLAHRAQLETQLAHGTGTTIDSLWQKEFAWDEVSDATPAAYGPPKLVTERTIPTTSAQDAADAIACYLDAINHVLMEDNPLGTDPQEDELFYLDATAWTHVTALQASLQALRASVRDRAAAIWATRITTAYDLYDANDVFIGTLALAFDAACSQANGGWLTLPDGTTLAIEWIDIGSGNTIAIDLRGQTTWLQAWFEGTISTDRTSITSGTIDFWAEKARVATGVTGQGWFVHYPPRREEPTVRSGPVARAG